MNAPARTLTKPGVFAWLLRREYWENRGGFLYAPLIAGLRIAVCEARGGKDARRVAAFCRRALGLNVFQVSPEDHDREAATVQGLTHLIARVLMAMEPLPTRMTTASFERLMQAIDMVRYDSPAVFRAIERDNPFAAEVRERFFALADQARGALD